jgi:hypothetical protein
MLDFIKETIKESFQSSVAKPRASRSHANLLDGGRQDLVKHGAPFNQARPKDKSNAFFANEDKELEEISSMSGGSVEGTPGAFANFDDEDNEKHKRDTEMIRREAIAETLLFKEDLDKLIKMEKRSKLRDEFKNIKNLSEFRGLIQEIIMEASIEKKVHSSTAINYLEELLDNIIPTIKIDYEKLTTDQNQRESFREHLINAVRNILELATGGSPDSEEGEGEAEETVGLSEEGGVDINIEDEDKFIDVLGTKDEEDEDDGEDPDFKKFRMPDKDQAGALAAYETINKVDTQIEKAYKLASGNYTNEKDREIFYDYLITNLKLHFDVFEDKMSPDLEEPTTPEYEKAKDDLESPVIDQEGSIEDAPVTETWGDKAFNVLMREEVGEGDEEVLAVLARNLEIDPGTETEVFAKSLSSELQKLNPNYTPITPEVGAVVKNILSKEK